MKEIVVVGNPSEYTELLPEVGRGILALFCPLEDRDMIDLSHRLANPEILRKSPRLQTYDIPESVRSLAVQTTNTHSPTKIADPAPIRRTPKLFGITHCATGVHADAKIDTVNGIPVSRFSVLGAWCNITGSARILLRESSGFTPDIISQDLDNISSPNLDPKTYGHDIIRTDARELFGIVEIEGPYIGSWAIGQSIELGIPTVFHQIETVGNKARISTNIHKALFQPPDLCY